MRSQPLGRDSGAQHCLPHSSQGPRLHVYAWSFQNLFCSSKIFSPFTLQPYLKNFGQTHITTLKLGPNKAGFITAQKTCLSAHCIQEQATLGKSGRWQNRRMEGNSRRFVLQKTLGIRNSFYWEHAMNNSGPYGRILWARIFHAGPYLALSSRWVSSKTWSLVFFILHWFPGFHLNEPTVGWLGNILTSPRFPWWRNNTYQERHWGGILRAGRSVSTKESLIVSKEGKFYSHSENPQRIVKKPPGLIKSFH